MVAVSVCCIAQSLSLITFFGRTFALAGGGVMGAPKTGGGGVLEKGSDISIGTKGARRKILSTVVCEKRVIHAYPPHVAGMIQCMALTRVYALSNRYAVTLVT